LQMGGRARDLALFDLGIDSKLRGCDLVNLCVRDVCQGDQIAPRASIMQQKTQRPVQFEITPPTREAVVAWIKPDHQLRAAVSLWMHRVAGLVAYRRFAGDPRPCVHFTFIKIFGGLRQFGYFVVRPAL
jgi:hypothetical protein